ncbi:MAG: GNAT family N-acetyltransferase [Hoeflea sp.]|uniref:GNAT family N-acetyltransferase n=1 Tax=Hoeflea sp. TaxID=1940281 RepID=UPI001D9E6790|nr:N-acetyltransferase family protein [Hoeflea sp.]MBU4529799.1 GNAT family N-acetyltransferase [Alphaproteobacteria bacterium]MBU4547180.1 GNAT family N-acetyltransferase [Alphaproteobacteria bacterium]MBU4548793.1 GNAT family N-acetyltransferase [Alphaproteobacteria bacterium]MBV1722291.1 GNAT family N-acetyltransferase [Hoeflea sp.]MBV1762552.1 GNAT family N-acetyltransferase [Hoeflea sp.]
MIIRDATAADLPAITRIYADSVENGVASYELLTPDEAEMGRRMRAITGDGYPYLIAEADGGPDAGEVLGYAYASPFRTRPAYRWLVEDSIYLAPEARGKGVGGALLEILIGRCENLGFRQMVAVIGGAHPASIAVHQKAGFASAGMITGSGHKHGRWLDTVFMQRPLGQGTATDPDPNAYPGTLFKG